MHEHFGSLAACARPTSANTGTTQDQLGALYSLSGGDKLAFPAGMVEPGMDVVTPLKHELTEEAVALGDAVNQLFETCKEKVVYSGLRLGYQDHSFHPSSTSSMSVTSSSNSDSGL